QWLLRVARELRRLRNRLASDETAIDASGRSPPAGSRLPATSHSSREIAGHIVLPWHSYSFSNKVSQDNQETARFAGCCLELSDQCQARVAASAQLWRSRPCSVRGDPRAWRVRRHRRLPAPEPFHPDPEPVTPS